MAGPYYFWKERLWPQQYAPEGSEAGHAAGFRRNTGQAYPTWEQYEEFDRLGRPTAKLVMVDIASKRLVDYEHPRYDSPSYSSHGYGRSGQLSPQEQLTRHILLVYGSPVLIALVVIGFVVLLSSGGGSDRSIPPERDFSQSAPASTSRPPQPSPTPAPPRESGTLTTISSIPATPGENTTRT